MVVCTGLWLPGSKTNILPWGKDTSSLPQEYRVSPVPISVYEWFQLSLRITTTRVVCDLLISQKHPTEKQLHEHEPEGLEKAPGPPPSLSILPSPDRVELPAPPHHQWPALDHGGLAFSCTKGQMKDTAKVQMSMGVSGGHTS